MAAAITLDVLFVGFIGFCSDGHLVCPSRAPQEVLHCPHLAMAKSRVQQGGPSSSLVVGPHAHWLVLPEAGKVFLSALLLARTAHANEVKGEIKQGRGLWEIQSRKNVRY